MFYNSSTYKVVLILHLFILFSSSSTILLISRDSKLIHEYIFKFRTKQDVDLCVGHSSEKKNHPGQFPYFNWWVESWPLSFTLSDELVEARRQLGNVFLILFWMRVELVVVGLDAMSFFQSSHIRSMDASVVVY